MNTFAQAAARSFGPEDRLIADRDVDALYMKYRARLPLGGLLRSAFLLRFDSLDPGDGDITHYQRIKQLGSFQVSGPERLLASGHDSDYTIDKKDRNNISLHVDQPAGIDDARRGLGVVAQYIAGHDVLRNSRNVAGVTYSEMGSVAEAVGFRGMQIDRLGKMARYLLQAEYEVFAAFNPRENRVFKPAMVYLPTGEFVDKFHP